MAGFDLFSKDNYLLLPAIIWPIAAERPGRLLCIHQ